MNNYTNILMKISIQGIFQGKIGNNMFAFV